MCFEEFAFHLRIVVHRTNAFVFFKTCFLIFDIFFKRCTGAHFRFFFLRSENWPRALLRMEQVCCLCLWSAVDCQVHVNDVFRAVYLSGILCFAMLVLLGKPLFVATQAFSLQTHSLPIFSNIQRLSVPRSVIHAGQMRPQFCGIGRSWMLSAHEACKQLGVDTL